MERLRKHSTAVWMVLTLIGGASMALAFFLITYFDPPKNPLIFFMVPMVICLFALGLRDALSTKNRLSKATDSCRDIATELGLDFAENGPANLLGWPVAFELTNRVAAFDEAVDPSSLLGKLVAAGKPKNMNIFSRSTDTLTVALFEHHFSDNDEYCRKTVAAIKSQRLALPYFALFPAGWSKKCLYDKHRLITSDPELKSPKMEAIASKLYADRKLEVGKGFMLLYSANNHPIDPLEVELRIHEALELYEVVCTHLVAVSV